MPEDSTVTATPGEQTVSTQQARLAIAETNAAKTKPSHNKYYLYAMGGILLLIAGYFGIRYLGRNAGASTTQTTTTTEVPSGAVATPANSGKTVEFNAPITVNQGSAAAPNSAPSTVSAKETSTSAAVGSATKPSQNANPDNSTTATNTNVAQPTQPIPSPKETVPAPSTVVAHSVKPSTQVKTVGIVPATAQQSAAFNEAQTIAKEVPRGTVPTQAEAQAEYAATQAENPHQGATPAQANFDVALIDSAIPQNTVPETVPTQAQAQAEYAATQAENPHQGATPAQANFDFALLSSLSSPASQTKTQVTPKATEHFGKLLLH